MNRFLLPIFLLVLSLCLFIFFTSPAFDGIEALEAKQASLDSALSNGKELQVVRSGLVDKLNQFTEEDRARLDKMLPSSVDNVRLIIDIDNVAARFGMTLRNVRVSASDEQKTGIGPSGKRFGTLNLSFVVTTTYENMKRFVADLERNLRVSDISSISFSAGDKEIGDYEISLNTYWIR